MSDQGCQHIFYRPEAGRCGDFIPFYWNGEYHLFHIMLEPWYHVSTTDFVSFKEYGVAIPGGAKDSQDRDIYTGCVIEKDGLFHIFYTGNNSDYPAQGKYQQVVLHAYSDDLVHWTKDPEWRLCPDDSKFAKHAWRDPHVFWNEQAGEYWMVLTGQERTELSNRYGCTVLHTSKDLVNWENKDNLYAPALFDTHECPDMFRMGDWWYLVFSTYTRHWETRYRMSKSPTGPWITPADDVFDGRTFYAAKTASDGNRRLMIGWTAVKDEDKDGSKYLWGGNLLAHELVQRADGTLGVKLLREIESVFGETLALTPERLPQKWSADGKAFAVDSPQRFSYMNVLDMPETCYITSRVEWEEGTAAFGLFLRADGDTLKDWYQIRLEPDKKRIVFDRSNRYFHDQSFVEERPWQPKDRTVDIKAVVSGSIFVFYVDGEVALSARGYDFKAGKLGLFVEEGSTTFGEFAVRVTDGGINDECDG